MIVLAQVEYDDEIGHWVCLDCGAHATKLDNLYHHATCVPGDSKRWENYYKEHDKNERDRE